MKLKNFNDYLKKRLSSDELAEIERQAKLEFDFLKSLQQDVLRVIEDYMSHEEIGFNELIRRLDTGPSQGAKIQKAQANLTLASIAHIAALIKKRPHLVFDECPATP